MKNNNDFELYLEDQLKDRAFAERFKKAGEAWGVALELADLRKKVRDLPSGLFFRHP